MPIDDQILNATLADGTLNEGPTPRGTSAWSVAVTPAPGAPYGQGEELVGTVLAERYEILQLLGQGGMGAVYKARDTELERFVALKLIRADLASNPEILRRFKQELILAREVTHRNVIRIFDLGQAKGFKFITMEFVEGRDLRVVIREKGKLSPEETVRIISQVCRALESAHAAGVVHRDLKPQNIMLDAKDRVYVMDFGIAHSLETPGMTQTGALMGTPEYMSPEQAKGMKVDPRSDLFALGIIFYEMLTGISPYKAETALATLLKRTQERPQPPVEVDPAIPKAISDVVMKCLEIDRDHRFSSAREILEDLGQEAPTSVRTVAPTLPPVIPAPQAERILPFVRYRTWIAGGAAVVLLAALGIAFRGKVFPAKRAAPVEQASLAVLPFRNASGDTSLDWLGPSLADMLSTDVGQSARLRTISPDRLHQVFSDLRITPGTAIDPDMVGRIAEFSNADTVVWGQYAKFGNQIRIDATLLDLKHNRRAPLKIEAASEKEIPGTVDGLAELIRKNLAVSPDVLKELKASSFQPSSKSLPALRDYNQGAQLLRDGKNLDAVKSFQGAIKEDPQFALAYARLAQANSDLAHDNEAEQYSRKAVDLSQDLPLVEKYLIEANHARIMKDSKKAIESYENLAKTLTDNADVNYALGDLYLNIGDFDKARVHYSNVLKNDPKNLNALVLSGYLEVRAGNPKAGLEPLNRALSLSIELDNREEKAEVLQAIGGAYKVLNKPDEALRNFQQSIEINRPLGKKGGVANSLAEMANVQASQGKMNAALASFKEALELDRQIGARKNVADTLIDMGVLFERMGQYDKALQLYKESSQMQRELGDESYQALCLNNIGNVYLAQGKSDDALTYYQQALQLRTKLGVTDDIAQSLHNLGEGYLETAQYENAMSSLLKALDLRRKNSDSLGGGLELHSMGMVFLHQGRYGAAVKSLQDAVAAFKAANDTSSTMAEILTNYALALALSGRSNEAAKPLDEAEVITKETKNDTLTAALLDTRGNVHFYSGDANGAKAFYQQSQQAAAKSKDNAKVLQAKLNIAKVAMAQGQPASAVPALRQVIAEANTAGLKHISVQASTCLASTMVTAKDYNGARQELQSQLRIAEQLGLRMEIVRIEFLLGESFRLNGNASEAIGHYRRVVNLLDEGKKDPGAERLLERPDLKQVYGEATRGSTLPKT